LKGARRRGATRRSNTGARGGGGPYQNGVHPRRPVQRKPGTRTPFLALRYGWGAPTAPRPTQAWNSDQPSVVWSDLHEPKKKIGRKTKKGTGAHRYPVLYVVHMYVSSARLMLIKTKPYHPHLAYCPVTWDLFVCHYCPPKARRERLVLHLQWTLMIVTKVYACEEPFLLIAEIVYKIFK